MPGTTGPAEKLEDIRKIAEKIGLNEDDLILYGKYKAKVKRDSIYNKSKGKKGKLILVTATTPTPFGEGKTTTSIGLSMALWRIGKQSIVSLREPSLGPVFGIKGGATGGGKLMVQPMEDINLHFTGDFHAVTSAHNLLSAMIDASIFHNQSSALNPSRLLWPRTIDMNDRSLRKIIVGLDAHKSGPLREESFVITPASEIMAILGLSKSHCELKERLGKILIGLSHEREPVFARDIKAEGAIAALLKDSLSPNIVQTSENTPAIVHTGPFGNIAHGTCSLTAIEAALSLSDFAVVEAGFGSDLGAEKFLNIVCRSLNRIPDVAVLVTTIRSLKFHGGVGKEKLFDENIDALQRGFENVKAHIHILKEVFGLPVVVAINRFPKDTDREIDTVSGLLEKSNVRFALSDGFMNGSGGVEDLAVEVVEAIENDKNNFKFLYELSASLTEKVDTVAKEVYGAKEVEYSRKAIRLLDQFESMELGDLYICTAKTQYSLSDQASLKGWPREFKVRIDDVKVKAGAGFLVPICGDILEMPGLPGKPAAWNINIDGSGNISGLF